MSDITLEQVLEEFAKGCTNAGPRAVMTSDRVKPVTDCKECTEAVIGVITRLFNEK